jgi:hypothetical protein
MSPLDLWIEPDAYQARKALPGHVRQRVKREIEALVDDPQPPNSRALDVTGLNPTEGWVWVLSIQRRPPYDYEDLSELVGLVGE